MLSSPLGQHILDYEPPHEFIIPPFAMYDSSSDPYDHMLCKTREKFQFLEKGKNRNFGKNPEFFLGLG